MSRVSPLVRYLGRLYLFRRRGNRWRALWLNASLRAELEARFGRPCTDEELAIAILHGHRPAFMVRRA